MRLSLVLFFMLLFAALSMLVIYIINPQLFDEILDSFPKPYQPFSHNSETANQSEDPVSSETTNHATRAPSEASNGQFFPPMPDFRSRVTKKQFGTYIEPGNSPVSPEKFRGYHNGIDLEIFSGEENSDIAVDAICNGTLAAKRTASGYGGLIAQYCDYQGAPVLVIYGHMDIASVGYKVGDEIAVGSKLGMLGQQGPETDGERKHLHLTIRKGHEMNIVGYVSNESALSSYYDPLAIIK